MGEEIGELSVSERKSSLFFLVFFLDDKGEEAKVAYTVFSRIKKTLLPLLPLGLFFSPSSLIGQRWGQGVWWGCWNTEDNELCGSGMGGREEERGGGGEKRGEGSERREEGVERREGSGEEDRMGDEKREERVG